MSLTEQILPQLAEFLQADSAEIALEMTAHPRLVADATQKILVRYRGLPRAFLIVSPTSQPSAVQRGAEKAHRFAQLIGSEAARHVALPYLVDAHQGLTYSISPYYATFSGLPIVRYFLKQRVAAEVLRWLVLVAKNSVQSASNTQIQKHFEQPLLALCDAPNLPKQYLVIAQNAAIALKERSWQPKWVASHNDMWSGNVLKRETDFVIIDWDGSLLQGYAFYDLVRAAESFKLNHRAVQRAIAEYCVTMQCAPQYAQFYLISAFAYLNQHLGAWPYSQYLRTLQANMDFLLKHTNKI